MNLSKSYVQLVFLDHLEEYTRGKRGLNTHIISFDLSGVTFNANVIFVFGFSCCVCFFRIASQLYLNGTSAPFFKNCSELICAVGIILCM